MKKTASSVNIKLPKSAHPSPADIEDAKRIEDDPAAILRLIDLIFGPGEFGKELPS